MKLELAVVLLASGCQLVAPLPDASGGGGGDTPRTDSTEQSTAIVDASSSSTASGGCSDSACGPYCSAVSDGCGDHPQYPSEASCCQVCSLLGANAMSCRPLPSDQAGAAACSGAGVIGPQGGTQCGGCAAVCALFAEACGDTEPKAVNECGSHCAGGMYAFNACATLDPHDEIGCRLQYVLLALDSTGPARNAACQNAADGKCSAHTCGP